MPLPYRLYRLALRRAHRGDIVLGEVHRRTEVFRAALGEIGAAHFGVPVVPLDESVREIDLVFSDAGAAVLWRLKRQEEL